MRILEICIFKQHIFYIILIKPFDLIKYKKAFVGFIVKSCLIIQIWSFKSYDFKSIILTRSWRNIQYDVSQMTRFENSSMEIMSLIFFGG